MIRKIISGGQTGADQAALDVAIKRGIPHGGWIPKSRITLNGPLPDKYNLKEMAEASYQKQIEQNVISSDGTVIFSNGPLAGSLLHARKMSEKHKRPWLHFDLSKMRSNESAIKVSSWILQNRIDVLNVTGPHASNKSDDAVSSILEGAIDLIRSKARLRQKMDKKGKEQRRFPRRLFSTEEGLIGIITRPASNNEAVICNILDISKIGLRISTKGGIRKAFNICESLILSAFKGTTNIKFSEPIMLEIRWINDQQEVEFVEMGCEVVFASASARELMEDFVDTEMMWKGMTYRGNLMKKPEPLPSSPLQSNQVDEIQAIPLVSSSDRHRQKFRGLVAVALTILFLALMFLHFENAKKASNKRLDSFENRLNQLQEKTLRGEVIGGKIQTVEEQVKALSRALDKIRGEYAELEHRLDNFNQQVDLPGDASLPPPPPPIESSTVNKGSEPKALTHFHKVQKGENLFRISLRYKTTVEKICKLNNILPSQTLYSGQKLKVPGLPGVGGEGTFIEALR